MYKLSTIFVALSLFIGLAACNAQTGKEVLNPHAFKAKMQEERTKYIIDVRTPKEYNNGAIVDAVNIDWNGGKFQEQVAGLDKNTPVFVYCKSGGRSGRAAQMLQELGFQHIYDLDGGITNWQAQGMKTTKDNEPLKGMNMKDYNQLLNEEKLVMVDFYTTWCTPCKKMKPFLKEIAEEQAEKLTLHQINTDKNTVVAQKLQVTGIPTILLYKSKKMVWRHMGYIGKEELMEKISTFN